MLLSVKKSGIAETGILECYHVLDRNERHDNDDDEKGSRTYPSRTSAGAAFANGEKHPELTRPLILLWGMINIPNWYMDWVLTCAQYELLMCDAPIVVYDKADTEQKTHTAKEMEDLKRKWEEKRKEQEMKGQRLSLNDFIVNGINAIPQDTKQE